MAADAGAARTRQGWVLGARHRHGEVFWGLPYAAPPQGRARFQAPSPARSWTGVRDATVPGATPPAPLRPRIGELDVTALLGVPSPGGEDYLTVNVWTPTGRPSACPVLVFVPGGGFVSGSGSAAVLRADAFTRDGVVVVTVSYRLGLTGWAALPGAPGNRGLLDVLAALRWVQDNIAEFGGDPDNVTLAGQSAGAMIVAAVLAAPAGAGVCRRAISQSGNAEAAFVAEQAQLVTRALGAALGVPATVDTLAGLDDAALVELMAAAHGIDLSASGTATMRNSPWGLVLDDESLPAQPIDALEAGTAHPVDLLVGSNTDEADLYLVPTGRKQAATAEDVTALASRMGRSVESLQARYRGPNPSLSDGALLARAMTDSMFGDSTRRLTQAHRADPRGTTHAYTFGWRSGAFDGQLGACHCIELPLVFLTTDIPSLNGPSALLGPVGPPAALATAVHDAWVGFIRNSDPGWPPHAPSAPHIQTLGGDRAAPDIHAG